MTLDKYELTKRCQAAGVHALPVQSSEDRVEHDPQLRHRQMYLEMEHPALGVRKVQNAPYKLSETPAINHLPSPLIGQHTREIVEGLLGSAIRELVAGYADGIGSGPPPASAMRIWRRCCDDRGPALPAPLAA